MFKCIRVGYICARLVRLSSSQVSLYIIILTEKRNNQFNARIHSKRNECEGVLARAVELRISIYSMCCKEIARNNARLYEHKILDAEVGGKLKV